MSKQMEHNMLVEALTALGAILRPNEPYEFVVIGGASLLLSGLIDRATSDVDILGRLSAVGAVELADPLPPEVNEAAARVARTLRGLPANWFGDSRTTGILDFSLPNGFASRLQLREFPPGLRLHLADRRDIVALKLLAVSTIGIADHDSKHMQDLRQLQPTLSELEAAQSWIDSQTVPNDPQHRDLSAIVQQLRSQR